MALPSHREASNPQDAATATAPPPRALPASVVMPRPSPAPVLALLPGQPHPSQRILATSTSGAACSIYYIYGASQDVALASCAAGTPFNPHSLDLPSIGALVGFYHACLGFPVKQTWLDAIKAGNCDTFEGLTYSNASKYCLDADKTIMGHLAQQRQNVRSTKQSSQRRLRLWFVLSQLLLPPTQPGLCCDSASEQAFYR
jgi:hypothetical protein